MELVDFGTVAADYARYREIWPDRLIRALAPYGVGGAGCTLADLGTGTGALGRKLAATGAKVTGVDVSAELLAENARLAAASGLALAYVRAPAEATGLPTGGFDAVTAGQCWHWFDRRGGAAEAFRLLKPGGALVIAHCDWVATDPRVARSLALLRAHRGVPALTVERIVSDAGGLYGRWIPEVAEAGFVDVETLSFDCAVPFTAEGWRGRLRACADGAALGPGPLAIFDAAHAELLAAGPSAFAVPHRVFALIARRPSHFGTD